jgi:hypothetical protein
LGDQNPLTKVEVKIGVSEVSYNTIKNSSNKRR